MVLETDDSGAIYTCPRDYTSRGTMIRHNYIHHSGPHHAPKVPALLRTEKHVVYEPMHIHGTSLIYLDDLLKTDNFKKAANELNADIIVLGSHSHRWLEDILVGSVTEDVLRATNIPLFLIPTKQK